MLPSRYGRGPSSPSARVRHNLPAVFLQPLPYGTAPGSTNSTHGALRLPIDPAHRRHGTAIPPRPCENPRGRPARQGLTGCRSSPRFPTQSPAYRIAFEIANVARRSALDSSTRHPAERKRFQQQTCAMRAARRRHRHTFRRRRHGGSARRHHQLRELSETYQPSGRWFSAAVTVAPSTLGAGSARRTPARPAWMPPTRRGRWHTQERPRPQGSSE